MAFNSQERLCLIGLNNLFVDQSVFVTIGTSSGVTTSKQGFQFECLWDCRRNCLHRNATFDGPVQQLLQADEVG
jgi:hypothetical protein